MTTTTTDQTFTAQAASITEGIQVREFTMRAAADGDGRELVGIAAPYGEVYDLGYVRERFEKDAFDPAEAVGQPLFYGHDHRSGGMPIGKVVAARNTDAGLEVRARISETPKGDEVRTLAADDVLTKFSVGFEPRDHRIEDENTIVHTRAAFKEVSVTPFPAYETAAITEVRERPDTNQKETVVETTTDEVAELRDTVTDLERRLAVFMEGNQDQGAAVQFRSGGELLKALAAGDENARIAVRAADGTGPATSAEADVTRPGWINKPLKLVQEKRRVVNLFSTAPLPATGNSVEYPFVASTSGTVGKQNAEGDALAYMEVALDTGTSPVATYGGYSSLSRQSIERSDLAYLDAVLRFQALQYAKSTEAAARTAMLSMPGSALAFTKLSLAKAADWIALVIDAAAAIEDDSLGLTADFAYVSRDVFKAIATLMDLNDRPVFGLRDGAVNVIGSASLVNAGANIAGLPVAVDPKASAATLRVASAEAFSTLESGGAPFKLQDENVVTLTKDFSLYGYFSTTANDQNGVVNVTITPEV